jgi:hypothetical protein
MLSLPNSLQHFTRICLRQVIEIIPAVLRFCNTYNHPRNL